MARLSRGPLGVGQAFQPDGSAESGWKACPTVCRGSTLSAQTRPRRQRSFDRCRRGLSWAIGPSFYAFSFRTIRHMACVHKLVDGVGIGTTGGFMVAGPPAVPDETFPTMCR